MAKKQFDESKMVVEASRPMADGVHSVERYNYDGSGGKYRVVKSGNGPGKTYPLKGIPASLALDVCQIIVEMETEE